MNQPLIELHNFCRQTDDQQVLHNINLTIKSGEKIALLGPSGAGKSTLLMALHQQLRDQCALCPQQLGLVDSLSVFHNIYMAQLEQHSTLYNLWNLLLPVQQQKTAIQNLGAELGIAHLLTKAVARLSGGERQRVAIARAIYRRKNIFLGDEPVTALDPSRSQQVLSQILTHHSTVVVALHDPQLALSVFDRIVGIRNGEIIFDRPSAQASSEQLSHFYAGL
ncbi:ATP-binding cassette domain-containing protein [Teredinibacter purpureus]|uniref:ATP-binding cassette domain-containing protein n=1 Tax=Teredinibacter purpureus TaxID=2731756 RepID=UPI0005F7EAAE|nr:ATP-binding cassette domain-containing protein [Teredinibacter purpureus]